MSYSHISSSLKTAELFIAITVIVVAGLSIWNTQARVEESSAQQKLAAQKAVASTTDRASLYLSELQSSLTIFAEQHRGLFKSIVNNPSMDSKRIELVRKLRHQFPGYVSYTLTNSKGKPLYRSEQEACPENCRRNINRFVQSGNSIGVRLQAKQQALPSHIQLMSYWRISATPQPVIAIRLEANALTQPFKTTGLRGYTITMVRPQRQMHTSSNYIYSQPLPNTRWNLAAQVDKTLSTSAAQHIWFESIPLLLALMALAYGIWHLVKRENLRRIDTDATVKKAYGQLESLVQERTQELSVAHAKSRESEARFRDLFETANDLIQGINRFGTIEYVNRTWERELGYSKEELRGKSIFELIHAEDKDAFKESLQHVFKGNVVEEQEFRLITKEGDVLTVEGRTTCSYKDGQADSARGIYRNVTEKLNAQEEAHAHREKLAHVGRLSVLGEMAATLAHELNQPLTSIANYARGCVTRMDNPEPDNKAIRDAMQRVYTEAERTGEFIRHVADFVRTGDFKKESTDPNNIIRAAIELTESETKKAQVSIVFEPDLDVPWINADAIEIEQVIVNLIRNSINAMNAENSSQREIEIKTSLTSHDHVCVTVQDTGPGVAPEVIDFIFDPFRARKESGLGLGLCICRSIIMAHEGDLWVEPVSMHGATFRFTVPIEENRFA